MDHRKLEAKSKKPEETEVPGQWNFYNSELGCDVVPHIDNIKDKVSNEVVEIWVWFEASR